MTREGVDVYRIEYSSPIDFILTENCMEIAYFDEAILDTYRRNLYFVDRGVDCYVKAVR